MSKGVRHSIDNEYLLLVGNLNKMYICDTKEELQNVFDVAIKRVVTMKNLHVQRIDDKNRFVQKV